MMLSIHSTAAFSLRPRPLAIRGRATREPVRQQLARRQITIPSSQTRQRLGASVTGTAYTSDDTQAPLVTLFTKEGCTLCDKVKDLLTDLRTDHPHSLQLQDITDDAAQDWFDRYKYDIPVLHLNGSYWIKHRLTAEQAVEGLSACREGRFVSPQGEPNASQMERS